MYKLFTNINDTGCTFIVHTPVQFAEKHHLHPSFPRRKYTLRAQERARAVPVTFISIYCFYRVPLHKTRTVRRQLSDSGLSLDEVRALATSTGAVDSPDSLSLPVERLTNFMDVRAPTEY